MNGTPLMSVEGFRIEARHERPGVIECVLYYVICTSGVIIFTRLRCLQVISIDASHKRT